MLEVVVLAVDDLDVPAGALIAGLLLPELPLEGSGRHAAFSDF